jgi:hypothetical protein
MLGISYSEKGLPALVVELACADFPTLDTLLMRRSLANTEKAEILAGICDGLEALHVSAYI